MIGCDPMGGGVASCAKGSFQVQQQGIQEEKLVSEKIWMNGKEPSIEDECNKSFLYDGSDRGSHQKRMTGKVYPQEKR